MARTDMAVSEIYIREARTFRGDIRGRESRDAVFGENVEGRRSNFSSGTRGDFRGQKANLSML